MGKREKKRDTLGSAFRKVFVGVALFILLVLLIAPSDEEIAQQEAEREADPTSGATYACRENIKAALLSPSSADWGHWSGWPTELLDSGVVRVSAQVEASNAYGAQIRQSFICEVEKTDGVWRLVGLDEI